MRRKFDLLRQRKTSRRYKREAFKLDPFARIRTTFPCRRRNWGNRGLYALAMRHHLTMPETATRSSVGPAPTATRPGCA